MIERILACLLLLGCFGCSGGDKPIELDASGKSIVTFDVRLRAEHGITRNDVLLHFYSEDGLTTGKGIPMVVELENRSDAVCNVATSELVDGKDVGKMVSFGPRQKITAIKGHADGGGLVFSDLGKDHASIHVIAKFEQPLPAGTKLVVRRLWADGP